MGLGDIFDSIFRLYRGNFITFMGIAALVQVPVILLQLLLSVLFGQQVTSDLLEIARALPTFEPGDDLFTRLPMAGLVAFFGGSLLLSLFEIIFVQQIINGALSNAIAQRMLHQPITILGAYQLGGKRYSALIGVGLLVALISGAILTAFVGFYIGALVLLLSRSVANSVRGALGALGILFCIIGLFIVLSLTLAVIAVRFLFVTQAIVIEGYNAFGALRRSWDMMQGSFWRIFGSVVLLTILVQLIIGLPASLVGIAIDFFLGSGSDPLHNFTLRQSITTLVSYTAQILVLPIQLIAYTLLYYDVRVRREGLDLELMTQALAE